MTDFFNKTEYTQADIDQLLRDKTEESLKLDYKESGALEKTDGKKKEISKDVSAFANSDGGLIIYGIKEKDNLPESLSFIDGNIFTKEWLEQVIQSTIFNKIEGLQIFPIRYDDDLAKSIYIVKIPNDVAVPHMAHDKRYYRRYNFNSVQMEEYEVRNLYFKKEKTQLKLASPEISIAPNGFYDKKIGKLKLKMIFHIENIGSTIEKNYKLEIAIQGTIVNFGFPLGINPIGRFFLRNENNYLIYSIPNTSPLFQNEKSSYGKYELDIKHNSFSAAQNNPIRLKLYYTGGIEELEIDLNPYLIYNDEAITIEDLQEQ
ncbi:MAG: ATP-binding protein [Bacteroidia bacterium]